MTSPSQVFFDRMAQQAEAVVPEEDWTGRASAAERRKLQNRLNQRAYRRRKAALAPSSGSSRSSPNKWIAVVPNDDLRGKTRKEQNIQSHSSGSIARPERRRDMSLTQPTKQKKPKHLCDIGANGSYAVLKNLQDAVYQGIMQRSPATDLLLSVKQFNLLRAMIANVLTLGMTMEFMREDNVSPFNTATPWMPDLAVLPTSLRPTALQKQIAHHPWLDPFPIPSIRDVLLRKVDQYDDVEICNDLLGGQSGNSGLIIWGEPWDASGFEVSEHFARKWGWMFKECTELFRSTDHWRSQRGEKPLFAMTSGGQHRAPFESFQPLHQYGSVKEIARDLDTPVETGSIL